MLRNTRCGGGGGGDSPEPSSPSDFSSSSDVDERCLPPSERGYGRGSDAAEGGSHSSRGGWTPSEPDSEGVRPQDDPTLGDGASESDYGGAGAEQMSRRIGGWNPVDVVNSSLLMDYKNLEWDGAGGTWITLIIVMNDIEWSRKHMLSEIERWTQY